MHTHLQQRVALPDPRPNLLIVDDCFYVFTQWDGDTMVYTSNADPRCRIRVVTKKRDGRRLVRRMLRTTDGKLLTIVDAYRVTKKNPCVS